MQVDGGGAMSLLPGPAYHFRTPAQWASSTRPASPRRRTLDPKAGAECGFIDCPAEAAALARDGSLFWVDGCGKLFAAGRELPLVGVEGPALGPVVRLVAGKERLWALADCTPPGSGIPSRRLVQLDLRSLQLLINRDEDGALVDIAPDGKDGLWLRGLGRAAPDLRPRRAGRRNARARATPRIALAAAGTGSPCWRRTVGISPCSIPLRARRSRSTSRRLAGPGWDGAHASYCERRCRLPGRRDGSAPSRGFLLLDGDGNLLLAGSWRDGQAPDLLAAAGDDLVGLFAEAGGQRVRRFAGVGRARQPAPDDAAAGDDQPGRHLATRRDRRRACPSGQRSACAGRRPPTPRSPRRSSATSLIRSCR